MRDTAQRITAVTWALPAVMAVWSSVAPLEKVEGAFARILLVAAVLTVTFVLVGFGRHNRQPVWPKLVGPLTCLVIIGSVMVTHWPLRVAYWFSQPAFDQFALQVRVSDPMDFPRRVGLFTIRKAEVSRTGIVCLWTDPRPGGNVGFVQCGRDPMPFNLWSMIGLPGGWQFIAED